MTKVAIHPISNGNGGLTYQAFTGDKCAEGTTAGMALDALIRQLSEDETGTLIVIQHAKPDHYFDTVQQQRLEVLMTHWRTARDQGQELPEEEKKELNALVETELRASTARAAALADELGQ